jgi:hypothetical protein
MRRSQPVAWYTVQIDASSFVFIISLAAVVNGLGIVRWLNGLTEYFRLRDRLSVKFYSVFLALAGFQFLLHVLFWWSLWSIRGTTTINFLSYLYLLLGPVLLFVATATLSPEAEDNQIDLRAHYQKVRRVYATVLILAWLWAIFLGPVLRGFVAPTTPFFLAFLAIAVVQRIADHPVAQVAVALLNWSVLVVFIVLFHMQLGGFANAAS